MNFKGVDKHGFAQAEGTVDGAPEARPPPQGKQAGRDAPGLGKIGENHRTAGQGPVPHSSATSRINRACIDLSVLHRTVCLQTGPESKGKLQKKFKTYVHLPWSL
jgi:hypothetical protein